MSGISKDIVIPCGGINYLMVLLLLEIHSDVFSFVISTKYNLLKVHMTDFVEGFFVCLRDFFCCLLKICIIYCK